MTFTTKAQKKVPGATTSGGTRETIRAAISAAADRIEPKTIADHFRALGLEVQEGVGRTGVVGILKGGMPGPVIGLRADMDALPIVERTPVPFASTVKTTFAGQEVGVMNAWGHDSIWLS